MIPKGKPKPSNRENNIEEEDTFEKMMVLEKNQTNGIGEAEPEARK